MSLGVGFAYDFALLLLCSVCLVVLVEAMSSHTRAARDQDSRHSSMNRETYKISPHLRSYRRLLVKGETPPSGGVANGRSSMFLQASPTDSVSHWKNKEDVKV